MKNKKIILLIILFSVWIASTELQAQNIAGTNATTDSLEQMLETGGLSDDERVDIYGQLSGLYVQTDGEKAVQYALTAIPLARKTGNVDNVAYLYRKLGDARYYQSRYDESLENYETVLQMLDGKTTSKKGKATLAATFVDMGNIHNIRGNSHTALEYYFRVLKLSETDNTTDINLINTYANMGQIYLTMNNFEQSESYFRKMEKVCIDAGDSLSLAYALDGLCEVYLHENQLEEALECAETANRIVSIHSEASPREKMTGLLSLATVWFEGYRDGDRALQYAVDALDYAQQCRQPLYIAHALCQMSSIYLSQKQYLAAEEAALRAFAADSSSSYVNTALHNNIVKANIMLGNKNRADDYFDRYKKWVTDYSQKNFQASLTEMEVKSETEKKETQIAVLEEEKRLMIWLSITSIAVLLLALAAFFFLWRWTVQKKRFAESQRELAEQQIKQLEQERQIVAAQAALDGETQERSRLARDLHDGLGSMLTGVKFNLESVKNDAMTGESEDNSCFDKAMEILNESMKELRRVAHHLMPDSLSRYGLKVALCDFCRNLPPVEFAWFGGDNRFDAKKEVMLYRVIHELVNNAMKHSGASEIVVHIMRDVGFVATIVRDNGVGFDLASNVGGMGLQNIRDRVASYGGRIDISSQKGQGTEINVELKLQPDE
ncbi:MAG: tetratricopeptide repeat protein [Prevotellaceae bacterium]|nr:tetratricopeptide repeat protein [Prevotellaceae bacterium]